MQRISILIIIIALSLTVCVSAQDFTTRVLSVKDSNNISAAAGTLRLNCAECPVAGQPFALQAKERLENLILGKDVDVHVVWTDNDDRQVAQLTVGGEDVAIELARAGLAWYDDRHQQDYRIASASDKAKAEKIGIWSEPNPVAPWNYVAAKPAVRSTGAPGSDPDWKYDPADQSYYYDPAEHGPVADPLRQKVFCNYCGRYHRNVTAEGCWLIQNDELF